MKPHETFLRTNNTARTDSPHPNLFPRLPSQTQTLRNQATTKLPRLEEHTTTMQVRHCPSTRGQKAPTTRQPLNPLVGTQHSINTLAGHESASTQVETVKPPYSRENRNQGGICEVENNSTPKLGYLRMKVGPMSIRALVDTGASISVMANDIFTKIQAENPSAVLHSTDAKEDAKITLADGQTSQCYKKQRLNWNYSRNKLLRHYFAKNAHHHIWVAVFCEQ